MKKKVLITIIAIVAVIGIFAGFLTGTYNGLVEDREEVEASFADVSVYLQRRADLIPNLVNTVKGYSDYEKETLTAVTEARNAFQSADTVNEQVEASNRLESALDIWVNAVTEAYPELKADKQFTALTDSISGTENRIAIARKDFNENAREYNTDIKKFPKSIIAGMFGFEAFEYFEASQGAENAPEVSFD